MYIHENINNKNYSFYNVYVLEEIIAASYFIVLCTIEKIKDHLKSLYSRSVCVCVCVRERQRQTQRQR